MNKILKFFKAVLFAGAILSGYAKICPAVQIEGFDPSGNFRTVALDASGRFLVTAFPSGVATAVVFVSSQPVNAFQSTTPWIDKPYTFTTPSSSQPTCDTNSHIVTNSSTRVSTLICNTSATVTAFVGPTGVTITTGAAIFPNSCFSPDEPGTFTGDLFCSAGSPITLTLFQGSP